MIEIYHILLMINFVSWMILLFWLFPAICRFLFNKNKYVDDMWSIHWFMAVLQIGYSLRYLFGLTVDPNTDISIETAIGLQTLSTFLSLAIIWKRYIREGFTI